MWKTAMKRHNPWRTFFLFVLLMFSVQSCLGLGGGNSNFKTVTTSSGQQVGINQTDQAVFKGKLYFTIGHNLYVLDGSRTLHQLTRGADVRDPAVSPNGKWIAFVVRYKNYADLVYMSTNGGSWHTLLSGQGVFQPNPGFAPKSTHNWVGQPAWSADSSHLIFLGDLQKLYDWANHGLGNDFDQSPFLDMQVFTIPQHNPPPKSVVETSGAVAYASYGDGGDRDPSYRPGHPNEIVYTHYTYDSTRTQQVIQIFMEDATMIASHPEMHYHPGDPGQEFSPSIAITPPTTSVENLQPAFSPDGNELAYARRQDATHMGIYVMPVPNGVTANPNNPSVEQQALQPYKKSSLIVTGEFVSQPVWSPDGKQIAYLAYNNNSFDIWLATLSVNPTTGAYSMKGSPVQLTDANGGLDGDSRPFWTP